MTDMFSHRSRPIWLALLALTLASASGEDAESALVSRIETQLASIERLLGTLRHVEATTEEGGVGRTRLTSEAWFVPGDAVDTPVKITLTEATDTERREMAFWLDQGQLFLVKERIIVHHAAASSEVTERRRLYDGPRLFRLETRSCSILPGQPSDLSALPYVPGELPAEAEAEGMMLEEIALETASQLAPVTVTNRPVRWE